MLTSGRSRARESVSAPNGEAPDMTEYSFVPHVPSRRGDANDDRRRGDDEDPSRILLHPA